ncbi:MAG: hypothetical protein VXZ22_04225 [Bacteroidota bacterium]|nr:hypothetical protein [Bacteroidota bacterium]
MKKFFLSAILVSMTTLNATELFVFKDSLSINAVKEKLETIEQETLMAVQTENYEYIEKLLETGVISSRMKVNGKPLIIHAAIHDKPEMILLLATYGAMLIEPLCDDGKDIMEYAKENNSIRAQAQIIIIKA